MATRQVYTSPAFLIPKDSEGMVYRFDVEAACTTESPRSQVYITDVTVAAEISSPLTEQVRVCEVLAVAPLTPSTDTVTLGAKSTNMIKLPSKHTHTEMPSFPVYLALTLYALHSQPDRLIDL